MRHRLALLYLSDALRDEPDDPDMAMISLELYTLIRLCLVKVDRRRDPDHADEADRLYGDLATMYRQTGAYISSHLGWHYYHPRAVYEVTVMMCEACDL